MTPGKARSDALLVAVVLLVAKGLLDREASAVALDDRGRGPSAHAGRQDPRLLHLLVVYDNDGTVVGIRCSGYIACGYSVMTVEVNVFAFAVTLCDLNVAPLFIAESETEPGGTLTRNDVPSVFVDDPLAGVPLESE